MCRVLTACFSGHSVNGRPNADNGRVSVSIRRDLHAPGPAVAAGVDGLSRQRYTSRYLLASRRRTARDEDALRVLVDRGGAFAKGRREPRGQTRKQQAKEGGTSRVMTLAATEASAIELGATEPGKREEGLGQGLVPHRSGWVFRNREATRAIWRGYGGL